MKTIMGMGPMDVPSKCIQRVVLVCLAFQIILTQ